MTSHAKRTAHPRLTAIGDMAAALALPAVEWIDDLTVPERVFQIARAFVLTVVAVAAIAALAACQPSNTPPATTGSAPTTTAPTTTAPTESPEEDEDGWLCSSADSKCKARL